MFLFSSNLQALQSEGPPLTQHTGELLPTLPPKSLLNPRKAQEFLSTPLIGRNRERVQNRSQDIELNIYSVYSTVNIEFTLYI